MARSTLDLLSISLLMIILLFVGCSSQLQYQEFDRAENSHINEIALLRVDEPKRIHTSGSYSGTAGCCATYSGACCLVGGGPCGALAGSFSGGAVGSSIDKKHSNEFRQALSDHHIEFGPAMAESVQRELTKKGYKVIYLQDGSPMVVGKEKRSSASHYCSHVQTDADVTLYVDIGSVGYASSGTFNRDFWPVVYVYAILCDSRSEDILYSRLIFVSKTKGPTNFEHILPSGIYTFDSLATLMENVDEAAQGIIACQDQIAARIAQHLE